MDEVTAAYNRIASEAESIQHDAENLERADVSALSAEALADIAGTVLLTAETLYDLADRLDKLGRERL